MSMKVHRDLPDSVALARRSAAFREIRYLPNVENPINPDAMKNPAAEPDPRHVEERTP
jgi:hypothetical protein